jgi:polyhydroxyalkanoate synthesis repressor PhaR
LRCNNEHHGEPERSLFTGGPPVNRIFCNATTIALAGGRAAVYVAAVAATLIKKYGNRRLYDTGDSRYITLDELAAKIRGGTDVRVVDATDGNDLTQVTLTQLILESGSAARMLPVPLLTQLIRLGDDALGEFFSRYVTAALELYLGAKRSVRGMVEANPLARIPVGATDALARMWMNTPMGQMLGFGAPGYPSPYGQPYPPPVEPSYPPASYPEPEPEPPPATGAGAAAQQAGGPAAPPAGAAAGGSPDDLAAMRRELDELKRVLREEGLGKPGAKRRRKG